jgi:signal transduction histidine kinase
VNSPAHSPQVPPPGRLPGYAVLRSLARDRIFLGGVAFVAALLALYTLPILSKPRLAALSEGPIFVPLLVWVVVATFARSRRAPELQERRFWGWIALGFLCWLLAASIALTPFWRNPLLPLRLIYDGLNVAFYLALFLATTKAPHEPHVPGRRDDGTSLVALGTVLFGVGMTVYFDLIPFFLDRADFDSRAPSFYLFLALDCSLFARAAALVRAAPDRRWRWPYALLLLATLFLALSDMLDLLDQIGLQLYESATATDFFWYGVQISVAFAASLREASWPAAPDSRPRGALLSSPLLTFAFIVPLIHFAFSAAGLLGARTLHLREAVALATMAGVLLVAWWHQSRLERSHLALERDLERERVRLRNAERLEAVGRMAGGVAHDFNNQLAVVLGNTELLEQEARGRPELAEPLREIREAATYAAGLTKELLSVGRRQALLAQSFDMNDVVRAAEPRLRALAGSPVTLEVALAPHPATVVADRALIERAIFTLAENAVEAMPQGGRLRLGVTLSEPRDGSGEPRQVVLEVADEGVGMSAEVLAHALEPFFTTKPFGQGSGLGLAAVNGAVAQLGGELAIESRPGHGTRVLVRLPFVPTGGTGSS